MEYRMVGGILAIIIGTIIFLGSLLVLGTSVYCGLYVSSIGSPPSPVEWAVLVLIPMAGLVASLLIIRHGIHTLDRDK